MLSTGRGEPRKVNLGALCKRNIGTEANVKLKKKKKLIFRMCSGS